VTQGELEMQAMERYEKFIDMRIDNGLAGVEWRDSNLLIPSWFDQFMSLDCSDYEFEQALTSAAARRDTTWRKRLGGPHGAKVFCHEYRRRPRKFRPHAIPELVGL
jgi:hypothetical protein